MRYIGIIAGVILGLLMGHENMGSKGVSLSQANVESYIAPV